MDKLTGRQQRFVEEYLVDLNATQAAIRAGYSKNSAHDQGSRLLGYESVRARIEESKAKLSRRTGVSQERVIRELARVAFANAADVIEFDTGTVRSGASRDDMAAIASVKVRSIPTEAGEGVECVIRMADKLKALELLGRHLRMFTDNINLTGDLGVQIVNDIPKNTG